MSGRRRRVGLSAILACLALAGCKLTSERDFVGKWQSSRALTPIYLMANGEWEIRRDDGTVLQYGVWRYANQSLIWSIQQGGRIMDDPTPVLTIGPDQFTLREQNGATTIFKRLP